MDYQIITSLADLDLYKLKMWRYARTIPDTTVKYKFYCRNNINLVEYKNHIVTQINAIDKLRFTDKENEFISELIGIEPADVVLDSSNVLVEIVNNELCITIEGLWHKTILWETLILSIVKEIYCFYNTKYIERNLTLFKTNTLYPLLDYKHDIDIVEFGTRRRYSHLWHSTVLEYLKVLRALKGTSNVYMAMRYDIPCMGTMAHEYIQYHQVRNHILDSQTKALFAWWSMFPNNSIALSDTLGFDKFVKDFDSDLAKKYSGVRIDSGDNVHIGSKVLDMYRRLGINSSEKTIVWSNNLTIVDAIDINYKFKLLCKPQFGIGTNLTCDLGDVPQPSIVIKAVEFNGRPVIKISDDPGKITCENENYKKYVLESLGK